ncbi:hypothetical protein ACYSNW_04805 [Enterococcus sp. LJL99]
MIKKAKIIMKSGASVDIIVESNEYFNELADNLEKKKGLYKINEGCRIDTTDISLISYLEENPNG